VSEFVEETAPKLCVPDSEEREEKEPENEPYHSLLYKLLGSKTEDSSLEPDAPIQETAASKSTSTAVKQKNSSTKEKEKEEGPAAGDFLNFYLSKLYDKKGDSEKPSLKLCL
jgi:hypothetical protein